MNNTSNPEINIDNLYKLLIDQSPFQVTFFDINLNLLYINEFSRKFNGIELDSVSGTSVLKYMVPEAREAFKKTISRISAENPSENIEHMNFDCKGQPHWYEWVDRGIFNKDGKLIGYQSIGQDITVRKKIGEDLSRSRHRLNEAQQIGRMGGWEWDIVNSKTYWSDEIFTLLGLKPEEIKPDQSYYHKRIIPEDLEKFLLEQRISLEKKFDTFCFEYRIKSNKNKTFWIRDRGKIEYRDNTPVKITGTILDITESKELQISLEEHIEVEKTLLKISNIFMLAEKEKTGSAIETTMEVIGKRFGADRAYLVLTEDNKNEIYQWNSELTDKSRPKWRGIPKETPALLNRLLEKPEIAIPSTNLWPYKLDYSWFKLNQIAAFITVALYLNNKLSGYLCIDSSDKKPNWTNIDFKFLRISGEMCANARESIRTRKEIVREKELLSVTLMSIDDGFILLAPDGQIEMINKSAVEMLGLEGRGIKGEYFDDILNLFDSNCKIELNLNSFKKKLKTRKKHHECIYKHPNGLQRILSYSCAMIPEHRMDGDRLALIFRDVTAERTKQQEIAFMSFHDSLTGLYNRGFMDAELKRLDTERQLPLSIITGDVNGLKLVNDVFGHEEGDKLIITIGEIMASCCRDEDVISRWGGDEFSIILPSTDQNGADRICERIRKKCERPEETRIIPSIALGSATKTLPNEDINSILREAEDRMYRQKLLDDRSVRSDIITSLQNSMFEKSFETEEHTKRMLIITEKFGKYLELPRNLQSDLNLLAIMHDMGKIAVPARILGKPDRLTDTEWEEIKRHPEAGFRIAQSSQKLSGIADLILSHHERWDGTGYPRGLKELEIPELARIISIVDSFDVMTNGRIYKKGISAEKALAEINRCSGTQFDPGLAEKFIIMMNL